jgi:hypothetical protein
VIYFIPFACFAGMIYLLLLIAKLNSSKEERLFYKLLANYKSCLVSPDLVKRSEDIEIYKKSLADEGIEFDAICTKNQNINRWQS